MKDSSNSDFPTSTSDEGPIVGIPRPLPPTVDHSNFSVFLEETTKPIKPNTIVESILRREKRGPIGTYAYQLFGSEITPIFSAVTRSTLLHTKYRIIEPSSGKILGNIKSDSKSLKFEVKGPEINFKVVYQNNFLGSYGARYFQVIFEDGKIFESKPPLMIKGRYYQDFHDMQATESIKNFVCIEQGKYANEVCIFVRESQDIFKMRITHPFNLFIAFALALTNLHTGLYHR